MSRQVVLDTETTGLEASAGHRIIEIGCVELVNRRPTRKTFHRYLNPERAVDAGALEVHGIDDEFLADQPRFSEVAEEFLDFVRGAELVIHNADFDVEFIDHELRRLKSSGGNGSATATRIRECCQVLDTLALARRMHPGQRNSLDALARRYSVDNSKRELHGALLDAQILAEVYLAMTGGQVSLSLDGQSELEAAAVATPVRIHRDGLVLPVLAASPAEQGAHAAFLARIGKKSGRPTLWERIFGSIDMGAYHPEARPESQADAAALSPSSAIPASSAAPPSLTASIEGTAPTLPASAASPASPESPTHAPPASRREPLGSADPAHLGSQLAPAPA